MAIQKITVNDISGGLGNTALDISQSGGTGAISIPVGTTAQRPSGAGLGYTRFNTDSQTLENYTANGWIRSSVQFPIITNITGSIYTSIPTSLTLTGSYFGPYPNANCYINFASGSVTSNVQTPITSTTSVTVAVPSTIYNLSIGNTVFVSLTSADGTTSGYYSPFTIAGIATGGDRVIVGNTVTHTFNSSNNFVVPTGLTVSNASYLIVAGGGGGGGAGAYQGAGGGAGGAITGTTTFTAGTYPASVGSGGTAGGNGAPSTFLSLTAIGGGYGGDESHTGQPGGSGGGAAHPSPSAYGSGTPGQGNPGGAGSSGPWSGGGGGGATRAGYSTAEGKGGGTGITFYSNTYAGGGGGAERGGGTVGPGGPGGGGQGNPGSTGGSGTTNTGGGGGGGGSGASGGAGGSGIVIVRYVLT